MDNDTYIRKDVLEKNVPLEKADDGTEFEQKKGQP